MPKAKNSIVICLSLVFAVISNVQASDKATLADKAASAKARSLTIEQQQLQKAKLAADTTSEREQKKILNKQQQRDWQTEQHDKAQQQFNERASREEKYLKDAKEAAKQERKISTPVAAESSGN